MTDPWKSISFRFRSRRVRHLRCPECRRIRQICPSDNRRPLPYPCTSSTWGPWKSTFYRSCTWTRHQWYRADRTTCRRWTSETLGRDRRPLVSNSSHLRWTRETVKKNNNRIQRKKKSRHTHTPLNTNVSPAAELNNVSTLVSAQSSASLPSVPGGSCVVVFLPEPWPVLSSSLSAASELVPP